MYEWNTHILLTVLFAFWFIELPGMALRGDFTGGIPWGNWIGLVVTHTLPIIFVTIEWHWSAIQIGWNRFPIYFGVGFIYLAVTIVGTFMRQQAAYASMNWLCHPIVSIPIVLCVLLT